MAGALPGWESTGVVSVVVAANAKAKTPKALDSIVDLVLAYRPKAKSKPAAAKIAKAK